MTAPDPLAALLAEVRTCRVCEAHLPLGPRPMPRAEAAARPVSRPAGSDATATRLLALLARRTDAELLAQPGLEP